VQCKEENIIVNSKQVIHNTVRFINPGKRVQPNRMSFIRIQWRLL